MKTVVITGSSSGIGKAAVMVFAAAGWQVAATMRKPEGFLDFNELANVKLYQLDVTDPISVDAAFRAFKLDYGRIDAIVNNAGFGLDGVFEAMDDNIIRK